MLRLTHSVQRVLLIRLPKRGRSKKNAWQLLKRRKRPKRRPRKRGKKLPKLRRQQKQRKRK
jgi:hypothetical protein